MNAHEKKRDNRLNWAACQEPYKTLLNKLAVKWVQGSVSNETLAFQAVKLLSDLEWIKQPTHSSVVLPVDDVVCQIKILTEAMLATTLCSKVTPELRRDALDDMRAKYGRNDQIMR